MKKYIFLIILTALFIRLYGSNYYPNFTMEECYQANQALEKYSLKSEQTDKNKYALYRIYYFLLNKLIVKSDFSAVSLKIVNALLSSLMVICFFLIGKKLGGETLGLFSSIILIFFPFHFINSRASGVVLHHSSFFVSLIFVYFIISFYFNRSLLYLIFSIIFACFAAVIHPL
nr:hypothetical protein [Candidatus Dependentiae bacterium]